MHTRKNQGFTLIEMVLITVVVAALATAAIPFLTNIGRVKAEGAANKLVSDISYARQLARSRNTIHGVSFDATNDTYTVFSFDEGTSTETPVTDPYTRAQMIIDLTQEPGLAGVDIQAPSFGGTTKVRFRPIGTPEDGDGTALAAVGSVLLSDGGSTRTIQVQPNTGEVSYQ